MAIPDEPLTRAEQYLNRTATGGGTIPEVPLTRVEMYLNKIATGDGDVPEVPLTRVEMYLDEIVKNGSVDPGGSGIQTAEGTFAVSSNTRNSPSMVHNLNTQMLFGVIYAVPTNGELSVGSRYAVLQCYFIAAPQFFNDAGLTDASIIYDFPYVTNDSAQSKSFAPGASARIVCLRSPYDNGNSGGSFSEAAATFRENTGNSVSIEASTANTGGAQFVTGLTYKWKIWGVVE